MIRFSTKRMFGGRFFANLVDDEQAGFDQYVIVDRAHPVSPRVSGYVRDGQRFVPQEADEHGRISLNLFGVSLAFDGVDLAVFDGDDAVPTFVEVRQLCLQSPFRSCIHPQATS